MKGKKVVIYSEETLLVHGLRHYIHDIIVDCYIEVLTEAKSLLQADFENGCIVFLDYLQIIQPNDSLLTKCFEKNPNCLYIAICNNTNNITNNQVYTGLYRILRYTILEFLL